MLAKRILTAVVGLPLGLAVVYLGGVWFTLGIALLAVVGLTEYFSAVEERGVTVSRGVPYASVVAFLLAAHLAGGYLAESLLCFLVATFTLAALALPGLVGNTTSAIANSSTTLTAVLYVAFLFSFLVLLRHLPGETYAFAPFHISLHIGFVAVFYLIAVSWLTDTGAFFSGRALGRRKLAPRTSPGKTVEGSIGGIILAAVIGIPIGAWIGLPFHHAMALALIGGVAGQVGDLAKSAIKRDAGIKDFGALFPGHGGVLDRFDSILFNAPLFYFYLRLVSP